MMKEKHTCCTVLVLSDALYTKTSVQKSLIIILSEKLVPFSEKNYVTSEGPFLTMFYSINSSPLLVPGKFYAYTYFENCFLHFAIN